MIKLVSQLHCTSRAEWRLQTGKPAKSLSPHYRLDCDYGTPVIICWKEGGSEPIYVCDSHAKQLGRSREHCPDARIIKAPQEQTGNPAKRRDQTESQEVAAIKSNGSASAEAARSLADARIITAPPEQTDNPAKREDRAETQEVIAIKSNGSASSEATRSLADAKVGRATIDTRDRPSARDLTYGSSAKAMVDEAIWNMAPGDYQVYRTALQQGKSPGEAAEAAGGQLAVIHRKINDYTLKLEAVLSKSPARINMQETIDKPLERAMLDTIDNDAMSDQEKDAVIQQLETFQQWVKQGLQGDITPLQANRIILAIGDRLNWGGNSGVSENFKPVYRALYGRLKTAICAADLEAQNLHDRLTNLYAAKSEIGAQCAITNPLAASVPE
jgi:hypothetical protein